MLNRIKNSLLAYLTVIGASLVLVLSFSLSAGAQELNLDGPADVGGSAGAGTCLSTDGSGCVDVDDPEGTVNETVALVINIFSWIVGVVSVIMIIWGGFKYITSGGDSNNVTTAKNTILYAIIGLIIVALAQIIVRFVLGTVTESAGI